MPNGQNRRLFFPARKNRRQAFSAVYDRYAPYVYTLSVRLTGSEDQARHLVSEVFKVAWENDFKRSDFQDMPLSRLINLTRQMAHHAETEFKIGALSEAEQHPIEQNTEPQPAQVLELFLLQGMSADEIAHRFQLGGNGVQHLITSAIQEVRKSME